MRLAIQALGILSILLGTLAGCMNWLLTEFALESVNWEGPWMTINSASWLFNILGFGIGGTLLGVGSLLPHEGKQV